MPATLTKQKTAETANTAEASTDEWEDSPSTMSPFCIPEVGDVVTGELLSRDVRTEVEKRKVKGKMTDIPKERISYKIKLTAASRGKNGGQTNGVRTEYAIGDVVTVPGAGALDRAFDLSALKFAGKPFNDDKGEHSEVTEADYQTLVGRTVRIERLPDGKLKGGEFKGNTVKVYDLKFKKQA